LDKTSVYKKEKEREEMKKMLFSLLALLLVWGIRSGYAHGPDRISLKFDKESKILSVEFVHKVRNTEDHFIHEIRIERNGEQIVEQKISMQESREGGSLLYRIIDAELQDELKVILRCSKSGGKTETLKIE
jgi:hypothetical protein